MISFVIIAAEATSNLLMEHIRQCCKLLGKRWRLAISTQNTDEALEFLLAEHAGCIVIQEVETHCEAVREHLKLIKSVHRADQHHVVMLVLDRLQMLELLVNCNVQPNGVLIKPLHGELVNKVLLRLLQESLKLLEPGKDNVVLQTGRNMQMVSLQSIVYLEAREKRVDIHTTVQRISVYRSLQSISSS
jgi:DNA-binding LytR/AlgR family response regulator